MFKEITNVRQIRGEAKRRWFTAENVELIVWFAEKGGITGFQLCYKAGKSRKAFTWHERFGFSNNNIDEGETNFGAPKSSPILVADGIFESDKLLEMLTKEKEGLEPEIFNFVVQKIAEYGKAK
ncbi:MAG: hypothetical protein HY746_05190 [Elusimicrobia bacterium]|nr:hypothetical protein [Elusimicrobiota bacterium]